MLVIKREKVLPKRLGRVAEKPLFVTIESPQISSGTNKDRDVIHTSAIAIKQALDLSVSIRLLPIASDFLLEGLTTCGTIAGFDPIKHFGLGERPGLGDFT